MAEFKFQQVDVFTTEPLRGNPLAVVIGADELSDAQMGAYSALPLLGGALGGMFGGYMNDNYKAVTHALNLDKSHLLTLARNGVEASFLKDAEKTVDELRAAAQAAPQDAAGQVKLGDALRRKGEETENAKE